MSRDHTTQDLKDRLACQNNKVCALKEKLVTYDRDVAMKEDLKCQLHNLQKWIEDVDCKVKQSNNQMINIINNQKQKTKEAETQECKLRSENTRLNNLNDCFTEKINTLNRKEQTLIAEIEKLELCKINIQNELCAAEARVNEIKCQIESLKRTLKTKEEECEKLRKQLTAIEAECKRLCMALNAAKCALERTKADIADVRSRMKKAEECLKRERTALADKLEDKERELQIAKADLETAVRTVAELRANVEKLLAAVAELRETMARERCEAEKATRALKEENCAASEKVCRAADELASVRRDNAQVVAKIESLKCQVQTNECQLDELRQLSEARNRAKDEKCEQLERERCLLTEDLQCKKKKIADLERQLCRMREESRPCGGMSSAISNAMCPSIADCCPSDDLVNQQDLLCDSSNDSSFIDVLKRLYSDLSNLKVKSCKPDTSNPLYH
ncbi:centromere-associated protein E-like [Rhopalosiphum maidis]|uniref:centromere-associated protein E-like n=1 Tax=Rhopalosiphum maidis TaxID=43146 RepID=UPI000EFE4F8D|nr:centromere-associated protein E-like [Rhopalosiphum maidis]